MSAGRGAAAQEPPLELVRVLGEDGALLEGAVAPPLTDDALQRAYRELRRLRLLDARMVLLQRQGRISSYAPCTGQEAAPVATALVLQPTDWVFPALRESGVMLARGFPLVRYLAQLFGTGADLLKGRQMPAHPSSRDVRQASWSSCVGTQLPHAVGAAMAARQLGHTTVVVGFLGDGATSSGDFHAAMNFAGVFRPPCVLICQNNQYAVSLPTSRQTASAGLAVKGRAYGVRSVRVDGNDLLALCAVLGEAAERARAGGGPTFVESVTYRIGAHATADDPTRYRAREEVERWALRDPVLLLRRHLVGRGLLDDDLDAAQDEALAAELSAAITEAEAEPPPARATLFDDVYAELPWHLTEQRAELLRAPEAPPLTPR